MTATDFKYVYGPVPSRRLGRSLGVDLVPFKTCTYDCIYCQLGRTTDQTTRQDRVCRNRQGAGRAEGEIGKHVACRITSVSPDPGNRPCMPRIGEVIAGIKRLTRAPVAVLTNGSLLWDVDVQQALMEADLVMPSLDAGDEAVFQRVNRPHREIAFETMVDGLAAFTARFPRLVWLEVLLVDGITGTERKVEKIAALARRIRPGRVQLNTVSRPPAEGFARAVSREQLSRLAQRFSGPVELISDSSPESPPCAESLRRDGRGHPRPVDAASLHGRRGCRRPEPAHSGSRQAAGGARKNRRRGRSSKGRRDFLLFYEFNQP